MSDTADIDLLLRALSFAAEKHRDQRRKDKDSSPYINHPIEVARAIAHDGRVSEPTILAAALLHDTVEDTQTTRDELVRHFGEEISGIVSEVTDDKSLPKAERKRLQVQHAATLSYAAKLVKLGDKISNLCDVAAMPPVDWSLERRQQYFDWAKEVVDQLRGTNAGLERAFDVAYSRRPSR